MSYNVPRACILSVRYNIYLIAFRQSRVPAVDLVSDPPTQLSTSSRGAEPSSESAAFMLDLLHGTVFHTIFIISVTLVFSSAASNLNYFVEHTALVLVHTRSDVWHWHFSCIFRGHHGHNNSENGSPMFAHWCTAGVEINKPGQLDPKAAVVSRRKPPWNVLSHKPPQNF